MVEGTSTDVAINAGPSHFHLSDDDEICFHGKKINSILDANFA